MPDTDVNLRVRETGANAAAAQIDRLQAKTSNFANLAPKIAQLGTAIGGLGQAARLIGPEFDKLGQSISNVAISAAGLGQIGAIFGPIGAAIGTILGGGLGILTQVLTSEAEAQTQAQTQANINITNNVEMKAELTGRTVRESLAQLAQQFNQPIKDVQELLETQTKNILSNISNQNLQSF